MLHVGRIYRRHKKSNYIPKQPLRIRHARGEPHTSLRSCLVNSVDKRTIISQITFKAFNDCFP